VKLVASRRRFGHLRKLPSGRWQASYRTPGGERRIASRTFPTKTDADRWLATIESDLVRGTWVDETLGKVAFGEFAQHWLETNPRMGARWRETCERNMRLHLADIQPLALTDITPATVRQWHARAMAGTGGRTSIAQSYRYMRAVLNTAVKDGAIARNPCQVTGAGSDRATERPIATPTQIAALIDSITPRYRAAVALAAWCGLRRGEILALHRSDLDLELGTVTVRRTRTETLSTGRRFDGPPKTDAGYRTVAIPPHILPIVEAHLATFAGADRVFVDRSGQPMRGDAVRQAFDRARQEVGLPNLRFHDLRHTGQTLAAMTGASLADLMRRLGHSSMVAARRYLHTSDGRDQQIAAALSRLAADGDPMAPRSVTQR
jgi:integrase